MEKLQEIRSLIEAELDQCNGKDTPVVCSNASDPEARPMLVDAILQTVISRKITVGQAIVEYEKEFNLNIPD
jgi:hypothetical protein